MRTSTARGAAAGAVGVVAMDVVTWAMYRAQSAATRAQEDRARPFGKDTAHALVRKVARAVGSDVGEEQPNGPGIAVHYGLGMGPGGAYADLRRRYPALRRWRGALYGLGLFVLNDEIGGRLLGITGRPRDYPWQAHLRGLVGHVVLGMATEAALNAIED